MRPISKMSLRYFALIFAGVSLALIISSEANAQDSVSPRSIEVEGTGSASAKPDSLVLDGFIASQDESAKKVLGKFLKIKKSLEETINPMDFPGVEVEFKGSALKPNVNAANAAMLMAGGGGKTAEGYRLSEPIKILIEIEGDDSEKSILQYLSKVVDSAETIGVSFSDATNPMMGVVMGGAKSPMARGNLKDDSKLNQDAATAAFAQAKTKAEQLAELAGGKLGKVISIADSVSVDEKSDPTAAYMNMITGSKSEERADSINKIEVSRTLRVKFELTD